MQSESTLEHPSVGRVAAEPPREEVRALRRARAFEAWAPLPLRVMLAVGFLFHGLPKLFSATGHAEFVEMLMSLSVPAPAFTAWFIGIVEVGGAVLIGLGALSRLSSILLILEMVVAAVLVHGPNGFNFIHLIGMNDAGLVFGMPGYEVNLLYISMLLAVLIGGPGKLSMAPPDTPGWFR